MRGDWVSPLLNPLLPVFPETQSHSATRTSLLIAGIPYKAGQLALCGSRAYSVELSVCGMIFKIREHFGFRTFRIKS